MLNDEQNARFDAYLRGELSDEDTAALEAALLEDEALLRAFDAYAKRDAPAEIAETLAPPTDFTDSVRQRIRRRSGGRFFQEDLAVKRYIPIFLIVAFVILIVIGISGRYLSLGEVQEDADAPTPSQEDASTDPGAATEGRHGSNIEGTRVTDRPELRELTDEEEMRAASANTHYRDLPVSGRPTAANVTYTRAVFFVESAKSKEALREDIVALFGERELVEEDGFFRMPLRERDYSGALQRMQTMDGRMREESRSVSLEELDQHGVRFYYDVAP